MNIVIIGAGKIGATLTEQLLREGHEITVVDTRTAALDAIGNTLDVMTVEGNGISMDTQVEAGVPSADLVIAVMSTDEQNLLSCLIAKRLGVGNTIARVRNPEYTSGLHLIQDDLGLSMALNPELASATEIARILRAPASIKIDTFSKGRVELHKMRIDPGSMLDGMKLSDLGRMQSGVLVCVVERGQHEVYIPDGSFTLLAGDRISVVASPKLAMKFFHKIGVQTNPVKRVMLLGGGRISYYLARQMLDFGASVKIIESSAAVCDSLAERLPEATIIHGDGTNHDLLESEGIFHCDAFIAVTDRDEENLLMALTAKRYGVKKVVPKMSRMGYLDIVNLTGLDTVISPKAIIASQISSYVRGLANSQGSAVESLHYILGGAIEAVEFTATSATHFLDRPLSDLHFRNGLLVAAIVHNGRMEIPNGHSQIHAGDRVIVVAKKLFLQDLNDILG